jgi:hypothetical protein
VQGSASRYVRVLRPFNIEFVSRSPLGDQLTKNMIQADLAAKALDPSKTTTKPNASKFNVFANFGEIKGERPDKDHRD